MHNIDWLHVVRVAVFVLVCLAILFCIAVWAGRRLALQAARDESAERIREARKQRLARILKLADEVEAAPEHERQRIYREAEALGFLDEDDPPTPKRAA